ncbi:hypothetical protein OPV22_020567 [Ensete ventricosum]|uniref:BHLH domain-containing protein n=1 Tax=Ensete ventricosum TaxID=4639 RepID=A0AAV8PAB3_ENSVE|nr:hypothetical protein OPV22_020567 [Ensete ventricosum]
MAFSYNDEHQHPSLVEFGYLPCTPTEIPFLPQQSEDVTTSASSCFLHCYSQLPVADATGFGGSGSLDIAGLEPPSVANRVGHAPMVGEPGDGMAPKPQGSGEKKRKIDKDETSLITGQAKEGKIRKQRRLRETDDKKPKADAMKASKTCGESPAGYIHVRARRGEATDSHSLAERVRREKISERMKVLQSIVPGCEKVTGKALMLDEIINYVQSLQNQVEFLSMKLASLNPMLYYGAEAEEYMNHHQPEKTTMMKLQSAVGSMPLPMSSSTVQANQLQPIAAAAAAMENGQAMRHSARFLLQGQGTTSFPEGGSGYMMPAMGEQREDTNSSSSFQ